MNEERQLTPRVALLDIDLLFHYQPYVEEHISGTLAGNRIRFSDHRLFNDPWDCDPRLPSDLLDNLDSRQRYRANFLRLLRPHCSSDDEAASKVDDILSSRAKFDKILSDASKSLVDAQQNVRVFCMSRRRDSALMWGHYARSHSGVCFGFRASTSRVFGRGYAVEYSESYPRIDPYGPDTIDELQRRILCFKSQDWAYEQEFRVFASEGGSTEGVLRVDDGFLDIDSSDLRVVIIGCKM